MCLASIVYIRKGRDRAAFHLPSRWAARGPRTSSRPPPSATPSRRPAKPSAGRGPRPDPSGRAPPPRRTHLRPRPRPNAEAAAGWHGRVARPSKHSHLPFPRHSAHPPHSATEQPPRSSAAPKSKGVRLRHHNQMAEPPWPAAQPAHWSLPPTPPLPLAVARRPSAAIGSGRCRSSAGPQIPPPRRSG
nr:translation initiation factor IF-2-like [Symphalangus syndactylus]